MPSATEINNWAWDVSELTVAAECIPGTKSRENSLTVIAHESREARLCRSQTSMGRSELAHTKY
jgi:hypothetical protein